MSTSPSTELSVEQKQIVEIARALAIGARFLILDEPTASLESHAIERLFERVRRVKASGVGILYISHHLEEVYEICDRATVLRDGKRIVSAPVTELDHERLVAAMVGGDLARTTREQAAAPAAGDGQPRLSVRGLSAQTPLGSVEDVSFDVHAGECVGLFGLRGSGTAAIADAVAGLVKPSAGEIELDGEAAAAGQGRRRAAARCRLRPGGPPRARLRPDARRRREPHAADPRAPVAAGGSSRARGGATPPKRLARRLQIVASGGDQPLAELSGGNQQKVVVGRALAARAVAARRRQPDRRGRRRVEGGAARRHRRRARRTGRAVLLVSDDLDELRICTRVLVVRRGAIVRELREAPWDRHELIAAAEGLEVAA